MSFIKIQDMVFNTRHIIRIVRLNDTTLRIKSIQDTNGVNVLYIDQDATNYEYKRIMAQLGIREEREEEENETLFRFKCNGCLRGCADCDADDCTFYER